MEVWCQAIVAMDLGYVAQEEGFNLRKKIDPAV